MSAVIARAWRPVAVAVAWALVGGGVAPEATLRQARPSLASRLESMRASGQLPAVAAIVFRSAAILEQDAVGVRQLGSDAAVTTGDRWHIGSITKSFTATLAARAVDRGEFGWTSTLGDLLGAERAGAYAPVTVVQLLGHRAGLPPNVSQILTLALARSTTPIAAQRQQAVDAILKTPPASAPGVRYQYSNAGYILMGAMLESRAGRDWEDLLRAEILGPLRIASAGFGAPGAAGALTEPRGHRQRVGASLLPVEPGPGSDNPPFLGPAGTLHMTLADLARWGQAHLRGERGQDGIVRAATFQRLHQPAVEGAEYALGWVIRTIDGRRTIWHNGSNTMWYAILAFDPDADLGVAIATNGSIGAQKTIDAGLGQLMRDWITASSDRVRQP
jgi:CubicO group peptidase (beta-lactamase class C family)